MITQKQLLEQHRKELDFRYTKRYPMGRFCLQFFNGMIGLHWAPKRNTSHKIFKGISIEFNGVKYMDFSIGLYQRSSFGKCYNFDSLEELVRAAQRHCVREDLTEKFIKLFNNRQLTLF